VFACVREREMGCGSNLKMDTFVVIPCSLRERLLQPVLPETQATNGHFQNYQK